MNAYHEETQTLSNQINEWSVLIESMVEKQLEAEAASRKYGLELFQLRAKYNAACHRLRGLEAEGSSFNIWENIGEGG